MGDSIFGGEKMDETTELNEKIVKEMERTNDAMKKSRERDTLKGKILSIPRADGNAFYEVMEVRKNMVKLGLRKDLGIDNYMSPILKEGCWIERENVKEFIRSQENIHDIFSG